MKMSDSIIALKHKTRCRLMNEDISRLGSNNVRADYENHTDKLVLVSSSDCCFDLLLILSSKNIQKLIGNIQGDFLTGTPLKS